MRCIINSKSASTTTTTTTTLLLLLEIPMHSKSGNERPANHAPDVKAPAIRKQFYHVLTAWVGADITCGSV